MASASIAKLTALRSAVKGQTVTKGLALNIIERFVSSGDKRLVTAIDQASTKHAELMNEYGAQAPSNRNELDMVGSLQTGYVNFYEPSALMPYVPLVAKGPWIVTTHGAVVHDSGGYGMLGFGHNDDRISPAAAADQVMANVMTPSLSHPKFIDAFKAQVGVRNGSSPYTHVMCMNSGSEAVELSARLTDTDAKLKTQKGGVHEGWRTVMMCVEGSFFGRTYRPARLSHSCREIYQQHLASFQHAECHLPWVVKPNDVAGLEALFAKAQAEHVHIECLYMEPCMGEGQPGVVLDRAFYDAARRLTKENHSLLLIDSIQAGLRAKGCLSVVDYPGYQGADTPDMETFSKAINGGQYPLSVLALQEHIAKKYVVGLYGNTMTTNPRALDIGRAVLSNVTPAVRQNILDSGNELHAALGELVKKHPKLLTKVTGSGLLQAVHLQPYVPMWGGLRSETPSFLTRCRHAGLGVINAGHSIKFTPHFELNSAEVSAIFETFDQVCRDYPKDALSAPL